MVRGHGQWLLWAGLTQPLPRLPALERQKQELEQLGEEKLKWSLRKQAHAFEQELKEKVRVVT